MFRRFENVSWREELLWVWAPFVVILGVLGVLEATVGGGVAGWGIVIFPVAMIPAMVRFGLRAPRRSEYHRIRFEVKREDAWIGAFWRRDGDRFDLWICFVPCFPLHYWRELVKEAAGENQERSEP